MIQILLATLLYALAQPEVIDANYIDLRANDSAIARIQCEAATKDGLVNRKRLCREANTESPTRRSDTRRRGRR